MLIQYKVGPRENTITRSERGYYTVIEEQLPKNSDYKYMYAAAENLSSKIQQNQKET